ncbi:MAG: LptE family protein [Paraprevotella sp.]|nr:LptE family protein [Paraprevotella sp.]
MVWIKNMMNKNRFLYGLCLVAFTMVLAACSITYKFNGASIDYTKTKTIQIAQFPIRSAYVWGPMQAIFNNQLTDIFARQTKLKQVNRNGDLQISGEIVEYNQFNKSVAADGYSAQTQLKMTVNVRFVNNQNHDEDFEQRFSATTQYDSSLQLNAVQEELVTQMVKDIVDQIFNATVANW